MNYGVPYKGNKNMLVGDLMGAIPIKGVENFYDLFAGGCAVTHKAMADGKFARYFANDLDGQGLRLFRDSVAGKYRDERRWISREDFARLKDSDPYVSCCWSFGNNQRDYLYSQEVEPWKKALHYARVLDDFSLMEEFGIHTDGSWADIKAHEEEYKKKYIRWWLSQQEYTREELDALIAKCKGDIAVQKEELRQYLLRGLQSSGLTQAEVGRRLGAQMTRRYFGRSQWGFPTEEYYRQMQTFMPALDQDYNEVVGMTRLRQSLQSLQSLQTSFVSYDEVEILPNSIIYCDPPYRGTDGYRVEFDHERFYDWCGRQKELVLVSEYQMPEDRFVAVWHRQHRSRLSGTANVGVTEKLFAPRHQAARYYELMRKPRWMQLELF